jgi:hypothetical protein
MSLKHDYAIGAAFCAHLNQSNAQRTEIISAAREVRHISVVAERSKTPARKPSKATVKAAKAALLARARDMIDGLLASKRAGVAIDPAAIKSAERILRAATAR